ncbi:dolichyldiphosphatase [Pseudohyphozyma bogoriensis]|nr:dolichyldiphosphatase [Pseudohyphozyma bogoriensis]
MSKSDPAPPLSHSPPGGFTPKVLLMSLLQNTQFVVTSLTILALLRIRSAHSLWFGAGTLVAAFTAKFLKLFIKQPRPVGAKKYERTYGMPSTHSSSIAFFGAYLALSTALLPLHPRIASLNPAQEQIMSLVDDQVGAVLAKTTRGVIAAWWVIAAGTVCWSRVKLGHHTPAQVLAGASLGSVIAMMWLVLWIGVGEFVPQSVEVGWLRTGVREQGMVWEHAVEDAIMLAVEAYVRGGVREAVEVLKVLKAFPVLESGKEL